MYKPKDISQMQYIITIYTTDTVDTRLGKKTYIQWGQRWANVYKLRGKEMVDMEKIQEQETIRINIYRENTPYNDLTGYITVDLGGGVQRYEVIDISHGTFFSEITAMSKR